MVLFALNAQEDIRAWTWSPLSENVLPGPRYDSHAAPGAKPQRHHALGGSAACIRQLMQPAASTTEKWQQPDQMTHQVCRHRCLWRRTDI